MYLLASAPKQKHDWLARMTLMGLAWVPRSELGYAFRSSQSTSIDVNCVSNLCSIVCFWILCALAHPLRCGFNQELPPCGSSAASLLVMKVINHQPHMNATHVPRATKNAGERRTKDITEDMHVEIGRREKVLF